MEKIKIPKIALQLTVEEVQYLNDLIERDTALDGIPMEDGRNKCPSCKYWIPIDHFGVIYCPNCGQLIKYNDSDVIPFEAD